MDTGIYTDAHILKHTHTCIYTLKQIYANINTHKHSYTQKHIHKKSHSRTQTNNICTQTNTREHKHKHKHSHIQKTHTLIIHTQKANINICTHKQTQTPKHTHTQIPFSESKKNFRLPFLSFLSFFFPRTSLLSCGDTLANLQFRASDRVFSDFQRRVHSHSNAGHIS